MGNNKYVATGIDEWKNLWTYRFSTLEEASMFIEAVSESQGCSWDIKMETDAVWSVDKAIEHFTQ